MKPCLLVAVFCILICSCKKETPPASDVTNLEKSTISQDLSSNFPILPLIEKHLWRKLLELEGVCNDIDTSESQREEANNGIKKITATLLKKHPFKSDKSSISLGGIRYDKKSRKISIPAVVQYPKAGDKRHPGELELILCSESGRSHETLFMTNSRPLHLEILLHLAGFKKSSAVDHFRVDVVIPNHTPIPIESLIQSTSAPPLPSKMLWEFSGSDFSDLYSPDQTGDFIILWHAHDSVLRSHHKGIASGEVKLSARAHPRLKSAMMVTIVLSPEKSRIPRSLQRS